MLKKELQEIITNGENSGIEFKRDDIRPEQLAKEIVAMANFQGGRVLLGIEDDGSVSGLQRSNTEEWVMHVIRDKIHPLILPYYETVQLDDGKRIAVLSFPQGISKPYVVRNKGEEKIYIRVGSTSQLATREQQMRLFEIGGMLHTELLPVPRTDISCLDLVRLESYLRDIINDPEIPATQEEWETRLTRLGFLTQAGEALSCTVAGLVLFGFRPRRYLKQAGIRVFTFAGEDKEYKALLDEIMDGPLTGRWINRDGSPELIDPGLLDRVIPLITPFITEEGSEVTEQLRRETFRKYPFEAVREVIVNALAHRDWTRFVDIEIGIYSDRLEVISPGALPNSMTVDKMIAGQRSPRNTIIMEVLRDYKYVDYRGMGIRTKVLPLMRKINQTEPEFILTEDYLKTVLYSKGAKRTV
ncbi:ATP-dependent DNA helicase RecG [Candidatus Electrothrix aarhusensis]|jgi:ATP-dependent DNA helicase RecG|uniref:ATP-dependent DNA helicase RecG n=1 Tax=Candidatus Electrothrix aarhusensis TaxID=1859131 RepID=A0A444IQG8_9BACT|nr:ATP-dependent DNA helicase RecG [Candidatus Electrothrix aarhusensis]